MHVLDIDIDDNLNPRAFKIMDNSSWDAAIRINNALIEVTPPSYKYQSIFKVKKDFSLILNANNLHLNSGGISPLPSIPDGDYNIKFSVDPNLKLCVEYTYFRNVKQLNKYFCLLTTLLKDRIKLTNKEYTRKKNALLWYKELIDGAKYLAEDRDDICSAKVIYNEVNDLLNNFSTCCNEI